MNQTTSNNPQMSKLESTTTQQHMATDRLIAALMEGKTFTEAALDARISRSTAYRMFKQWKDSEEAVEIDRRFWALIHRLESENPIKALEALTRIKARMVTEHVQIEQESALPDQIVFDLTGPQEGKKNGIVSDSSQVVRQEGKLSSVKPVSMEQ